MSLVKQIKTAVKNSGSNKGKIVYFKADTKVRIRFLHDVDDGMCVPFHDSYALGINVPCQEIYKRDCEYCGDEDLRHRELYAWSVYDYDANEVKILLAAANSFSPVPALVGMYEEYGTLTDRDYVINRTGAQMNTTYSVVPMDKATFKNKKVKAMTKKQMLEVIDKAYPADQNDEKGKKPKRKVEDDDWDDEDEDEKDYDEMSVKELYKLCIEREIEAKPKKKKPYYIDLLEAADNAEYDDEDDDDEDEDEDEEW